ncbi:MAG: undecaprenyl/decaprenyl-phosphate alpha-N-acetylglucosaminyl 1-phosphate transferase, partial [Patescibacteria group bacterium]
MSLIYILAISGGFLTTLILVPLVKTIALKVQAVDLPRGERKIHDQPIPLLGGLAVFLSTFFVLFLFRYFHLANFAKIPDRFLWGIFIAGGIIMLGGFLDDKYNLKPWQQIIWPILASLTVIFSGVHI